MEKAKWNTIMLLLKLLVQPFLVESSALCVGIGVSTPVPGVGCDIVVLNVIIATRKRGA